MRQRSTADEIEEQNRIALRQLRVFKAAVDEHFIHPLRERLLDQIKRLCDEKQSNE